MESGLAWWWAGLSATLIYGGSFEFLLIGMVTALAPLRASATVQYLSTRMPAGVMVIQVVSCLHDLPGPHVRVLAPSPPRPSPSHCTCGAATRC
ncbi:hypothetical protein ACF05W_12945 [Streptomyces lydicus]|uniref:hypothetical protein n=1 Tax=Streptomyces lydicus TaxID=47763 RepID=UPI0036F6FD5C